MFRVNFVLLALGLVMSTSSAQQLRIKELHTLHKWSNLSLGPDQASISHFLPVDLDIEYGDEGRHRTFLTIPRLSTGTPFTLATVTAADNKLLENPRLEPYPSLEWHQSTSNCSGITSAIRTYVSLCSMLSLDQSKLFFCLQIDECWRLWVVDSGQVNSLQLCAPQILIFDLVKDDLVQRSMLPPHMYTPSVSIFTALVVDLAESKCLGGRAYIADAWGYGLIVFDALTDKSWRIEHDSMQPSLGVRRFGNAHAGIFTVSLSPSQATGCVSFISP